MRQGGAPDPGFSVQADLEALRKTLGSKASIAAYYEGAMTTERRNEFIDTRVSLANLAYLLFISDLSADRQNLDAAAEMSALGLNLLGTEVACVRAKANLAATAAGLGGSKAIVDKTYYYEKTTAALVATMNGRRKEILLRILDGARKPLNEYSFSQAVADTHQYYFEGTLIAAIQAVQAGAAAREALADQQLVLQGEAKALTDDQIDERRLVVNAILAATNSNDLSKMRNLLQLLGLGGLPQNSIEEARSSLLNNYRPVLRAKPDLPKEIKSKL
jgi:hypothetical protein